MTKKLPYMVACGAIDRMLDRISEAQTPPRFTQDFLSTKLGFKGGNNMALIPLLKKMGFLGSDGTPTPRYTRFRNPDQSGKALAEGIRQAYFELFSRNEYAHELNDKQLKGLIVEITGAKADSVATQKTVKTFMTLKARADFDAPSTESPRPTAPNESGINEVALRAPDSNAPTSAGTRSPDSDVGLRLSYTINLNLPETANVAVFDAIFKSLKENLLQR